MVRHRNSTGISPAERSARRPHLAFASLACLAGLTAAGCAVGPDFQKPAAPTVSSYTPQPVTSTVATPGVTGGQAQTLTSGADIAADWWSLFHSTPLDTLIKEALANNHDLKAAQAALRQAHESMLAGRGAYYPAVTAGMSATRQQDPPGALASVPSNNAFLYDLFTPQLSISYVPDVFGLTRRTVESLTAQEDASRYQMMATYTTLTSNVAVTAIQLGTTKDQIAATRELVASQNELLKILQYQQEKGYSSGVDVAAQEAALAQTEAGLPPLVKQEAQLRDMLAVLVGRFPSEAPTDSFALSTLTLPQDVPLSLPSALVAQRPDILQAEASLHAASAQIGVAIANRLPNLTLTGNAGSTALQIGQLFTTGTGFWNVGAAVAGTIFDGGALQHQEGAARAAFDQASEQYRSTVLTAFQNVADTLAALQQDAEGLKSAAHAEDAAKRSLELTERQYKDGYAAYQALLAAQQAYRQAHIALVQAQASRFQDTAALFQALGGGWWHNTDLARNDSHE